MSGSFRLLLIVLLAGLVAGCRQSAQAPTATVAAEALTIDLAVEPEPPATGDATLLVTVTDAGGQPVDDATVSVRGDMNHAGMVPVEGEAESGEDGVYRVPFEWTMGGDWIVTVTVARPDGATASETFDLSVESGSSGMDDM